MEYKLTIRQHRLLVEALRRWVAFQRRRRSLERAWLGLGTYTTYKPALEGGLMDYATSPNPGHITWWKLTPLGIAILKTWIAKGYSDYRGYTVPVQPPRSGKLLQEE